MSINNSSIKEDKERSYVSMNNDDSEAEIRPLQTRDNQPEPAKQTTFKEKVVEALTSYQTNYKLRVHNRYLGYLAFFLISILLCYFFIYIFLVGRFYVERQKANGSAFVWVEGRPYSAGDNTMKIWQLTSSLTSSAKYGIVTLPTRVRITANQKLGECPNALLPCQKSEDCDPRDFPNFNIKGSCKPLTGVGNACQVTGWCPAENVKDPSVTTITDLIGVDEQKIAIKSSITFPLKPDLIFTPPNNNKFIDYPEANTNTFSIANLLTLAGTTYDQVKYTGCVLKVNVFWNCDLDKISCVTHYETIRLDNLYGYSQKHSNYYRSGTDTVREEVHYSGVKVIVNVVGIAEKFSIVYLFVYFFAIIALLYGVRLITDCLMLNVAREKRHYSELKFKNVEPDRVR